MEALETDGELDDSGRIDFIGDPRSVLELIQAKARITDEQVEALH